jgi:hypothetical protein
MNTTSSKGWHKTGNIWARRVAEDANSVVIETWVPYEDFFRRELYHKDGHLEMFVGYIK